MMYFEPILSRTLVVIRSVVLKNTYKEEVSQSSMGTALIERGFANGGRKSVLGAVRVTIVGGTRQIETY